MADKDGLKIAKDYHVNEAFANPGRLLCQGRQQPGLGHEKAPEQHLRPQERHTVMFAFDHGYFMGSTAGLERLDLVIPSSCPMWTA